MSSRDVSDRWERGDPYERFIGRWSRRIAPRFLEWLEVPRGRRWLDVGCGTGALSAAIVEHRAPNFVAGVEPSEGFLKTASERLGSRAALMRGGATGIPLRSASVDAVVSGLMLNFVPDARAAVAEMARVTARGGAVGAYVWDYAGSMEILRRFWNAAVELDPKAASLDEGNRFPLCAPDALARLFAAAGLARVEASAVEIPTPFESFDDYWRPFLGATGPAPAYVASLDKGARSRLREQLRESMPAAADGSIALTARAWSVRGAVA